MAKQKYMINALGQYVPIEDDTSPMDLGFTDTGADPSMLDFLGTDNGFLLPGDLGTNGQPQATDSATANRQMTLIKNLMGLMTSPEFNYFNAVSTGADTFDFGALTPGGGTMDSGSSDGSGSSSGSSGLPKMPNLGRTPDTPQLDSLSQSDDVWSQSIAKDIRNGVDPTTIKLRLRADPDVVNDPDKLALYATATDEAWKEARSAQSASADNDWTMQQYQTQLQLAQQQQVPEQSALAKEYAKWGLPDPNQTYGVGNLPSDVDLSQLTPLVAKMMQTSKSRGLLADDLAKRGATSMTAPVDTSMQLPMAPQQAAPVAQPGLVNHRDDSGDMLYAGNWDIPGAITGGQKAIGQAVTGGLVNWDENELYQGPDGELSTARLIKQKFPDWAPPGMAAPAAAPVAATPPASVRNPSAAQPTTRFNNGLGPISPRLLASGKNALAASGDAPSNIFLSPGKKRVQYKNDNQDQVDFNRRASAEAKDYAARTARDYQNIVGVQLTKQGRTPAKDRLNAQMQLLRSMGLPV